MTITMKPAAERVEEQIRQEMSHGTGTAYSRRECAARLMRAKAQTIADAVLAGEEQWPPRLEEYAALRPMVEEMYR